MPSLTERRFTPRFRISVALVFCPVTTPPEWGHAAKSINISARGVFFKTTHPVFVGLPVRVVLTMPKRFKQKRTSSPFAFTGRVTHVKSENIAGGGLGVGVEFFYSEAVTEQVTESIRTLANLLPKSKSRTAPSASRSHVATA